MHSGQRWTLGKRPALDGLRGVAILLVIACHAHVPWLLWSGGTVGVSIFFTLSGFLITSLLLHDHASHGGVRFGRFYIRRGLRILPALLVLLAFVLVLGTFVDDVVRRSTFLGTLGYYANWTMIDGVEQRGVLGHTWSLSIEEQFYLLWPPIFAFLARRSMRLVVAFGAAVCALSLLERLWLYDPMLLHNWRIYFGLDTRADGLLYGCVLAVAMRAIRVERARPALVVAGLVGIALATGLRSGGLIVFGPTLISLCTVLVIFGAAQGSGFRALEWPTLRWVGQRSYGMYLWYAPVAGLLDRTVGDGQWWLSTPILLGLTLVLAAASWRFVEQPFLRMKDRPLVSTARSVVPLAGWTAAGSGGRVRGGTCGTTGHGVGC